jgi:plasmid maintenance system antidote protein VapI
MGAIANKFLMKLKNKRAKYNSIILSEKIYNLYIDDGLSMQEVANLLGIDAKTVSSILNFYGIPKRGKDYCYHKNRIPEEILRKQYIDEKISATKIADDFGIHATSVYKRLREYGIEIRPNSESKKGLRNSPATEFKKGHKITWIGTSKENDIREKLSAAKRGSKNPMWHGGIQDRVDAIEFRKSRKVVLERDGRRCQLCGSENKQLYVHHMIPYRISPRNEFNNLISLCSQCHTKAELYYRKHSDSYMDIYFETWSFNLKLTGCF